MKAATSPEQNFNARKIIIALVVLLTVCLLSLIIAGVTSLISLADRIHPVAGTIVFWSFFLAAGFFALYCVIAYARLPAALIPPEETSGPRHEAYLQALRARLAGNPRTRGLPLVTPAEIEAAVGQGVLALHPKNSAQVYRYAASFKDAGRRKVIATLVHLKSGGPVEAHGGQIVIQLPAAG